MGSGAWRQLPPQLSFPVGCLCTGPAASQVWGWVLALTHEAPGQFLASWPPTCCVVLNELLAPSELQWKELVGGFLPASLFFSLNMCLRGHLDCIC